MSEPLRVLVVDDSVQIRTLLAHALRLRGFTPVEADGGAAALRLLMTQGFAIAIIDQHMPGMTGAELASTLGLEQPGMKTLFMTGHPDDPAVLGRFDQGGVEVIQKPFYANVKAALCADKDINFVGNAIVCGYNHSADTPNDAGMNGFSR